MDTKKIIEVKSLIQNKVAKFTEETPLFDWHSMFLSGGVFVSLFHNEVPKDWDFYFLNEESMTKTIQMIENFYAKNSTFEFQYANANAVTLPNKSSFISLLYGTPEEVKKTFDYVHCCPHYSVNENKLYISEMQYDAIVNKKLIINNHETVTEKRRLKFIDRGFKE